MKNILKSRIFLGCISCAIVLSGFIAAGIYFRDSTSANTTDDTNKTTTTSTTTTSTTTTTLPPKTPQLAPSAIPLLNGQTLGSGSNFDIVALVEQRLLDLKFDPGTVDTIFDGKTQYAVQSLQKLKGLEVTGRVSDVEINMLNTFQYDDPFVYPAEANRFEISLDKQVGILYENNFVKLITTVSTGNGKDYCYVSKKTSRYTCSKAVTPTGRFEFGRRYKGYEKGDLGELYNPVYFNGGIAVHGYNSVPITPASHGCTRIPMYIANYFPDLVVEGQAVYVVGSVEVLNVGNRVGGVVDTTPKTTTPEVVEETTVPTTETTTPATEPSTTIASSTTSTTIGATTTT